MIDLLRKWFGSAPALQTSGAPIAAASSNDESIDAVHEEFCRTFCHRPGVNFMDFLKAEGVTQMIDWLRPATPCGAPKAFIRYAVNITRKGEHFWDIQGLSILYEGNWDQGGLPNRASQDALSVLAQILGKPIKVYFREKPGGELLVARFEP